MIQLSLPVARSDRLMSDTRLSGSNHKTAARWNRGLVLRLLRQHGSLSRRQISQMTGLRGSTLTYIVRELMEKDVLRSVGKQKSASVGKKQVMLDVNPKLGYVLGISLRPHTAQLLLMDASGARLNMMRFPVSGPLEKMPAQLHAGYVKWLEEMSDPPAGKLLGIGLGIPGVVDSVQGIVLNSVGFYAKNVPLRHLLADLFDRPVVIDHDACFGAVAEATEGAAKDQSHFVYFAMNYNRLGEQNRLDSFGSALYLEGHAYRGAHFAAGELKGQLGPRRDLILNDEDLQGFADSESELTPTMKLVAEAVGNTLASITNFLDVPVIVFGGNCNVANVTFIEAVQQQMNKNLLIVPGREIRIEASRSLGETVARGAAITAVQSVLEGGWLLNPNAAAPHARSQRF